MKLNREQRVSLEVAQARALAALRPTPLPAAAIADAIWPDHGMKRQGAGAAASRILKGLERRGQAAWESSGSGWGWVRRYPQP